MDSPSTPYLLLLANFASTLQKVSPLRGFQRHTQRQYHAYKRVKGIALVDRGGETPLAEGSSKTYFCVADPPEAFAESK